MARSASVLGGMSAGRFLREHWQRDPPLVRRAFASFEDPLSPDELAGLSCEAGVESRLVREKSGRRPWEVTRGPQKASALRKLGPSRWTLLVESMDRHHPGIEGLARAFSFLPRWRMDDVMVSLAPVHGTVGAHIDSYDVFLVQGRGRRRWEIDRRAPPEYRPGLDLRILKRFRPQEAWVLNPGDMLYVPPGVAHRGVTVRSDADIALTYSIGFRSPSSSDLLASLLRQSLDRDAPDLFADPSRGAARDPGEISAADLRGLRRFLAEAIDENEGETWIRAAGEALTAGGNAGPAVRATVDGLKRRLLLGARPCRYPGARLAWARLAGGRAILFVNGESRVLPRSDAFAAALLCGDGSSAQVPRFCSRAGLLSLTAHLVRGGVLTLGVGQPGSGAV